MFPPAATLLLAALTVGCTSNKVDSGRADPSLDSDDRPTDSTSTPDADGDGWSDAEDCADDDPSVHPDATEICDGLDQDCDGEVDDDAEEVLVYRDRDGDGYGAPGRSKTGCVTGTGGWVLDSGDCGDQNASVHPGADERCNFGDDDCDGVEDEGITYITCYRDLDHDGWGDPDLASSVCEDCGYGWNVVSEDCDDDDPHAFPGAPELCDEADDDCDGEVDEGFTLDGSTLYRDSDRDGYGNPRFTSDHCTLGYAWVPDNTDCDDHAAESGPGSVEICDDLDNDCDRDVDEDLSEYICYGDRDGDGFGFASEVKTQCEPCAGYWVSASGDCDNDPDIYPGATELCNSEDDDCDGEIDEGFGDGTVWYRDYDGDGYGDPDLPASGCDTRYTWVRDNTDCKDSTDEVSPSAVEICDGLDDDCDGEIDDGLGTDLLYFDADEDGFGDPAVSALLCTLDAWGGDDGWVEDNTDCRDNDPDTWPGADERCEDGWDRDCDGLVDCEDEDCASSAVCSEGDCTDGRDADGDGFTDCADDECWGFEGCPRVISSGVTSGGQSRIYERFYLRDTVDTCEVPWDRYSVHDCTSFDATSVQGTARIYAPGATEAEVCAWGLNHAHRRFCAVRLGSDSWRSSYTSSTSSRSGFWVSGDCGLDDSGFLPPVRLVAEAWFSWYPGLSSWDYTSPADTDDYDSACHDASDVDSAESWTTNFTLKPGDRYTLTSDEGG